MFCDVNAYVIIGGVLISLSFECGTQIWWMSTVVAQFWVIVISPQWTPYHPDLSALSDFTQNWGNDMNHPELRESLLNHPDLTSTPIFEVIYLKKSEDPGGEHAMLCECSSRRQRGLHKVLVV